MATLTCINVDENAVWPITITIAATWSPQRAEDRSLLDQFLPCTLNTKNWKKYC